MVSHARLGSLSVLVIGSMLVAAAPPSGNGGGGGNAAGGGGASGGGGSGANASPRPRIILTTPGYTDSRDAVVADLLVSRIEFTDGVIADGSHIVLPSVVHSFAYQGGHRNLMLVNGPLATVGEPGVTFLADQDLDPNGISLVDRTAFSDRMRTALRNANLNNRLSLTGNSSTNLSVIVSFETRLWDSHFSDDQRPEIFIFEEQGNSVLRLEALDENLSPVGSPVEVRAVDLQSIVPSKGWVGRFSNSGALLSGAHEVKVAAIDLSRLGVHHIKHLRISNQIAGGGETSADFKVMGIDTSPSSAAQTICFD
jgi:hypothetical protein